MKIDRISYEELFPTGIYQNIRMRAEASIGDGDSVEDSYKLLQIHVQQAFQAIAPPEMKGTVITPVEEPQPKDKTQSFIETINYCTNVTMLQRFKAQVDREQNEELTNAYNAKLEQLTNNN